VVAVKNVYCLPTCNLIDIYRCFRETCSLHLSESHDEIVEINLIPHVSDVIGSGQPHLLTSSGQQKPLMFLNLYTLLLKSPVGFIYICIIVQRRP
jgi:hypothetical protein